MTTTLFTALLSMFGATAWISLREKAMASDLSAGLIDERRPVAALLQSRLVG